MLFADGVSFLSILPAIILVENAFYHNYSVCVFKLLHCEKYKVKVLTEFPSALIHQIVLPQLSEFILCNC